MPWIKVGTFYESFMPMSVIDGVPDGCSVTVDGDYIDLRAGDGYSIEIDQDNSTARFVRR